jgi:Zn-dependent protease/predicted transcriptional regulator
VGGFNLGKIFGIQVRLHYTWFIIFLLVTFSLVYPNWSQPLSWVTGIITSLLLFVSVLAHELAHSLVGRVNDIPVKSITLFIFGGIAQMGKEATKATSELKMAAAGPACSLVIGGIFGLIWFLSQSASGVTGNLFSLFWQSIYGLVETPTAEIARGLAWLALTNVALAAFNLIPGFPMDGGRVFRALMWRFSGNYKRSTQIATWMGRGVAYSFILGGILIMFTLHDWLSGIWIAFIGWFLQSAASTSYRQMQWREALHGLTASQMMTTEYLTVPPDITVKELVQEYVMPRGHHLFLVTEEEKLKGILTLQNIKSVPRQKWDTTRVEQIMVPASRLKVASPEQDGLSVAEEMDKSEINQMPVASRGRLIGLVTRDNLMRFLRTRAELGIKGTSRHGGGNG